MDKDALIQYLLDENKRLHEEIVMLCEMGIATCDDIIGEDDEENNE